MDTPEIERPKEYTEKEQKLWNAILSVHTVKGYPSTLWVLIAQIRGGRLASFYDINEPQRKITGAWRDNEAHTAHRLSLYKVFTNNAVNQADIDKATDAGQPAPEPQKYLVVVDRIFKFIQDPTLVPMVVDPEVLSEKKEIDRVVLGTLMAEMFPDADLDQFKGHHMIKVWKWFLVMKKYFDALPADETLVIPETAKADTDENP